MKKNKWKKSKLMKMAVISLILGILSGTGTEVIAQAAKAPTITELQVGVTEDGTQIMAQCGFQNYDDKSGCVMTLYLYRVESESEMSIAAYQKISYGGEGKALAVASSASDGTYLASVGLDYGGKVVQINSEHYYRVTYSGDKVEVSKVADEEQSRRQENALREESHACVHELEDELVRPATAEQDALMAKQCMLCGAVLDYAEVPNSAYAAFQKEAVEAIRNAQTDEVIIRTQRWVSFHQSVLEALSARSDVKVTVQYRYQGEEYKVTIPAGAEVNTLADKNGFCGFRYLNLIFDESDL